jgi:hypothetical protein
VVLALIVLSTADNFFNSGVNAGLYKCPGPRIRKSWSSCSSEEKQFFVNLVYKAKQIKGAWTTGTTSQSPLYDVFPNIHKSSGNGVWHYTSAFVAAHKGFLHVYESALTYVALKTTTITEDMTYDKLCEYSALKYWAWETDYDMVTTDTVTPVIDTSSIWDASGGCPNCWGQSTVDPNGYYVNTGLFKFNGGWTLSSKVSGDPKQWQSSAAPYYDAGLKRLLDPKEIRLDPTQIMDVIINNPGFSTFLPWSHGAGHSCMHLFLGFSMKTQSSPDEPLFFMHHCNVDRLFHLWADCWDYETIPSESWTDLQYVEINPTPGGTEVSTMVGSTKTKVRVLPDTQIPFYMGSGSSTIISPSIWPRIKDLWTCGEPGNLGWYDMYVRYGPDKMAQALDLKNACKAGQVWRWVNCGTSTYSDPTSNESKIYGKIGTTLIRKTEQEGKSTKTAIREMAVESTKVPRSKRGETTPEVEDNETKMYREIEETLIRKTEQEGLSPKAAIREMAMENCLKNPKQEMTAQRLSYLRMMGIAPSSMDRICDEPSQDPNYAGQHQHPMHI